MAIGSSASRAIDNFPGTLVALDLSDTDATQTRPAKVDREFGFDAIVNNVGLVRPRRRRLA